MNESYELDQPEHFLVDAVGPKGARVFYLQIVQNGHPVTFKVEKQQVAAMADYLESLMGDMPPLEESTHIELPSLVEPIASIWAIGQIGVGYDAASDRIILHGQELQAQEDPTEAATVRVHLQRSQIAAFIDKARQLVAAGRPACPYCNRPLDPEQGLCACYN